jgi:chorismate mutase
MVHRRVCSIHYGKFVAESKFLSERAKFSAAIRARDIEALKSFITKPVVEEQVLERVRNKAAAYGRPPLPSASPSPQLGPIALAEGVAELALGPAAVPPASAAAAAAPFPASAAAAAVGTGGMVSSESHAPPPESDYKVAPEIIAQLYETIMTLNKDVQIAYLLQRLDE